MSGNNWSYPHLASGELLNLAVLFGEIARRTLKRSTLGRLSVAIGGWNGFVIGFI